MIRKIALSSIALFFAAAPAYAAPFTCTLYQDGEQKHQCQLDSSNDSQSFCEYSFTTGKPVLGFCYAFPAEETSAAGQTPTGGKTLLGCGFGSQEVQAQARSAVRQRAQAANRRPQGKSQQTGFYAVGDTIGVNDDVLVDYLGEANYTGLCTKPAQ